MIKAHIKVVGLLAVSEGGIKIFLGVKTGKPYADERKLFRERSFWEIVFMENV